VGGTVWALDKVPMLTGAPLITYWDQHETSFAINPFIIARSLPVIQYQPNDTMFLLQNRPLPGPSTIFKIKVIQNITTGTPTVTNIDLTVPPWNTIANIPQPGAVTPLEALVYVMSGCVRNGRLWTAHAIRDPSISATRTLVRWYEFDVTNPLTPLVLQAVTVDPEQTFPGNGDYVWNSHINVDSCGNMALGLNIGGPNRFPSMAVTGKITTDPPNTTQNIQIIQAGLGDHENSAIRNRWGDYSGLAVDANGNSFWVFNEYGSLVLTTSGKHIVQISYGVGDCCQT
jgi:hypothetical protein